MAKPFSRVKRLFGALLIIQVLALPALAGHTQTGNWCQCGCFACICDEGEQPGLCGASAESVSDATGISGQAAPTGEIDPSVDFGPGALLAVLALLALARFRGAI